MPHVIRLRHPWNVTWDGEFCVAERKFQRGSISPEYDRVVLVIRGLGAATAELNDEPLEDIAGESRYDIGRRLQTSNLLRLRYPAVTDDAPFEVHLEIDDG